MAISIPIREYPIHTVVDGATGKWRGAQVWAVGADTLTLKIQLEANIVGERVVARSLAPGAVLGDPLVCQVEGDGAASYVVTACHGASFAAVYADNTSVAAGLFQPGRIPHELSGEAGVIPWWRGRLSERG